MDAPKHRGHPARPREPGGYYPRPAQGGRGPRIVPSAIAAEGTRGKGESWKSGFYRIAQQTGLPISLGFVDGPTRTLGMGPSFHPTGDVVADMDFVRAFYADKQGIRPANRTEPKLREEAQGSSE